MIFYFGITFKFIDSLFNFFNQNMDIVGLYCSFLCGIKSHKLHRLYIPLNYKWDRYWLATFKNKKQKWPLTVLYGVTELANRVGFFLQSGAVYDTEILNAELLISIACHFLGLGAKIMVGILCLPICTCKAAVIHFQSTAMFNLPPTSSGGLRKNCHLFHHSWQKHDKVTRFCLSWCHASLLRIADHPFLV